MSNERRQPRSPSLRLLILEDCPADAELMVEALRDAGFDPDWRRVDSESTYLTELEKVPDLILSDYSMPQFDARRALRLLKERGLDVPFIIVSGCIGEDVAVQCMKDGAADYLLKDRLARLGQAASQSLERKRLLEEKLRAEERLLHEAFHDALTSLPNRALFLERLQRLIVHCKRDEAALFAVLFLSLEGVKVVNDSLGPSAGDQLLIEVSHRLVRHVRSSDTVARLGGDEFVVLLDNVKAVNNTSRVAARVQQELAAPFLINGGEVCLTASIGITTSTTGYDRAEDILRDAGAAMYRAKSQGKPCFVMFDTGMHDQAMARLKLETDLRRAVEREEFRLFYQPIISLRDGGVAGFEALLRWDHPERGLLAPCDYIVVAEEIGVVIPIGRWALHEACRQLKEWQAQFPNSRLLTVSVNLSGQQFSDAGLLSLVERTLRDTNLEATSLKLEITETVMMDNVETATTTLLDLKARHIGTCMDDFGTGYSSLSYLQRFPVDVLKIDRSFISRMHTHAESLEIVQTIITLAHHLDRAVVAEGVETQEQLALLRSWGCEYGQGYYFRAPLSCDAVPELLASDRRW